MFKTLYKNINIREIYLMFFILNIIYYQKKYRTNIIHIMKYRSAVYYNIKSKK